MKTNFGDSNKIYESSLTSLSDLHSDKDIILVLFRIDCN